MIKKSAGLVIIKENRILLIKPKGIESDNHWSIPKGYIEDTDANIIETALRETFEETGINIPIDIVDISKRSIISYTDNNGKLRKIIFYFVVKITEEEYKNYKKVEVLDNLEVEKISFLDLREAKKKIYFKQLSVLNHIKEGSFNLDDLNNNIKLGYINKKKHPKFPIWIYNITSKCKKELYWNYTTLSCRGLILDESGKIIARPFQKFFESQQVYNEIRMLLPTEKIRYEKLDGALGILYWFKNQPYITSKNNFDHALGQIATTLLYNDYLTTTSIPRDTTLLFEIISDKNSFTIIYNQKKIVLIGSINIFSGKNVSIKNEINFNTPKVIDNNEIIRDYKNVEGGVEIFADNTRIKIKTEYFNKRYIELKKLKEAIVIENNYKNVTLNFIEKDYIEHFKSKLFLFLFNLYLNNESNKEWDKFVKSNFIYWI